MALELKSLFDKQSPSTVRICHSVGTARTHDVVIESDGCKQIPKIIKNPLGIPSTKESPIGSGTYSGGTVPSSISKIFLILVPREGSVFHQRFDTQPQPSVNVIVAIALLFVCGFS